MRHLALTGGIGSGKSTVAEFFADHGATIIDADAISRELMEPGQPVLDEVPPPLASTYWMRQDALTAKPWQRLSSTTTTHVSSSTVSSIRQCVPNPPDCAKQHWQQIPNTP